MSDTRNRLLKLLDDKLGITSGKSDKGITSLADVKDEHNFIEDLGADSLDAVELVMSVEEEFGIEIPDNEQEALTTVGALLANIEGKLA